MKRAFCKSVPRPIRAVILFAVILSASGLISTPPAAMAAGPERFEDNHYRGQGDVEYLQLLEWARRMFEPNPEFASLPMLYTPRWNGFVEGPTWGMWWIQNSYGTSYCALPFLHEPYVTFLENSQALWFDRMGDGKREGCPGDWRGWITPDG